MRVVDDPSLADARLDHDASSGRPAADAVELPTVGNGRGRGALRALADLAAELKAAGVRSGGKAPVGKAPGALLCDLDGTLIDSEPLWADAVGRMAARHGVAWSRDDDELIVGWALPAVADVLRARGVDAPAETIVTDLHDDVRVAMAGRPPWRPGAYDVLAAAAGLGLPSALVTMTYRGLAMATADAAPAGALDRVVAGDDVAHGKPDPEAYLTAARLLGVDPGACVVLEDSKVGLAAGLAAGCWVVAVGPTVPADLIGSQRLTWVASYDEVIAALA